MPGISTANAIYDKFSHGNTDPNKQHGDTYKKIAPFTLQQNPSNNKQFIVPTLFNPIPRSFGGKWSAKYKKSINCRKPKGFSQKQHCYFGRNGRRKTIKRK